jgi:hypothetical protein
MVKTSPPEILTDGTTVWVNAENGLCLARFGTFGIDIHSAEFPRTQECVFCTHERTTAESWRLFVEKVLQIHGILVNPHYCPKRFKSSGLDKG